MSSKETKSSMSMKAEKKILSQMSSRKVVKAFSSERIGTFLDNLFDLCKIYTKHESKADEVVNNTIRVFSKFYFLKEKNQFNAEEVALTRELGDKFQETAKAIHLCYECDSIFEREQLTKRLTECKTLLKELLQRHVNDNNVERIEMVFDFYADRAFLNTIFMISPDCRDKLKEIVAVMPWLLQKGSAIKE